MADPFDELKSEIVNNIFLLQEQVIQARKAAMTGSRSTATAAAAMTSVAAQNSIVITAPPRALIDELLLSLQSAREDADLLRSACRALRRRLANPSQSDAPSALLEREAFCEKADDDLDRIHDAVETMQRNRIALDEQQKTGLSSRQQQQPQQQQQTGKYFSRSSSAAMGAANASGSFAVEVVEEDVENESSDQQNLFGPVPTSSAGKKRKSRVGGHHNDNDDDDDDGGNNNGDDLTATGTGPSPMPFGSTPPRALQNVDNRNWNREAALRKLRSRQRRRTGEADDGEDDGNMQPVLKEEIRLHGATLGRASWFWKRFRIWAIEYFDSLDPQQRLLALGVLLLLACFLIFAVFVHHRGGDAVATKLVNSSSAAV